MRTRSTRRTARGYALASTTSLFLLTACGSAPKPSAAPCPTPAPSASAALPAPAPTGPVVQTVQVGSPTDFKSRLFLEDTYPKHDVTFAGGVTGIPDVTYATVPGFRPLKLDLYLPPAAQDTSKAAAHPFVVFLHGGGWAEGAPRLHSAVKNWPEVLASLAAKGYVVASVSYRFMGEAPFPAPVQDAKRAIAFLRKNADTYGIDTAHGLVWGVSAGGQVASLVALACGNPALEPPPPPGAQGTPESTCVQGAVGWFGIYDFSTYKNPRAPEYLRCGKGPCSPEENAKLASAVNHVDEKDPPFLLVHGDADTAVPLDQSKALQAALAAKKVRAELVVLPGVTHGFLGPTAEATQHAHVEALEKTFAFVDSVLGAKR